MRRVIPAATVALVGSALGVPSCRYPATQVLAVFDTDAPSDRAAVLTVELRLADGNGDAVVETFARDGSATGAGQLAFPASLTVLPPPGRGDAPVEVRATLRLLARGTAEPELQFTRAARFGFTPRQSGTVRLFLPVACGARRTDCTSVPPAQCTASVRCDEQPGLTCGENGECVTRAVTPAPTDPDDPLLGRPLRDAGRADDAGLGADAPAGDAGGDDAPPATACPRPELAAAFDTRAMPYARTLYVAPGGDDGADGSAGAPLATPAAALRRATPGTRVVLRGGTYGDVYAENVRGTAAQPIALSGEPGVVLAGTGHPATLTFVNASFVVVEHLSIVPQPDVTGLAVLAGAATPTDSVVVRDVRVAGGATTSPAIRLMNVDHFVVAGCDASQAGGGVGLFGCHDGVVARNSFHDMPATNSTFYFTNGTARVVVHGNRITDVSGRVFWLGVGTDLASLRPPDATAVASQIVVASNVVVRSGAGAGGTTVSYSCDGCVVAHNTVVEPRGFVARILQETVAPQLVASRNGLFVDNVVALDTRVLSSAGAIDVGSGTAPETFVFGSNLWFALDRADFAGITLPAPIPPETGSLVQRDPLFVMPSAGDYHLTPASPAVGAARDVPALGTLPDYDGACFGAPAAMGAFAQFPATH